jgi:hypothetical protein
LLQDAWKHTLNGVITEQENQRHKRAPLETVANAKLDSTIATGSSIASKWTYHLYSLELEWRRYEKDKMMMQ